MKLSRVCRADPVGILPGFLAAMLWISYAPLARCASSKGHPPLQESASFGAYGARTYFDPDSNSKDAYFEILKDNKRIYRQQATENGEKFVIGVLYKDDPDAKLVAIGRDITGDGQPDLLISEWSGGANCCLTFHLFEIGTRFRKIAEVDAAFGDQGPHFAHLANGPGVQIQIYDWTFANWHSDFADSPAPKVVLEYKDRTYRVAPDLMRTPSVDAAALTAKAEKIRSEAKDLRGGSWPDAEISPLLWGTMLDLIYGGHSDSAWHFMDEAWPPKVGGKDAFRRDFTRQLKASPYWKLIPK